MNALLYFANVLNKSQVNIPEPNANADTIKHALTVLYEIVGALAFLLILIAALRYVVNSTDPNKISESKRMIAYTLVGVAVIVLAATIVGYVLGA